MMMQNLQRLDTLEANANNTTGENVPTSPAHDSQVAEVLTRSFETWLQGLTQESEARKAESTAESMNSAAPIDPGVCKDGGKENVAATFKTGEATAIQATESTDTTTYDVAPEAKSAVPETKEEDSKKPQPPVKRPQAGYVRVSNPKRKRRGKLTFAKQG